MQKRHTHGRRATPTHRPGRTAIAARPNGFDHGKSVSTSRALFAA